MYRPRTPAGRVEWELFDYYEERGAHDAITWIQLGAALETYKGWGRCPIAIQALRDEIEELRKEGRVALAQRLMDALYGPKADTADPFFCAADYALDGARC